MEGTNECLNGDNFPLHQPGGEIGGPNKMLNGNGVVEVGKRCTNKDSTERIFLKKTALSQ